MSSQQPPASAAPASRVSMALEISELVAAHTGHYEELLDAAASIVCRAMGDICVVGLLSADRRRLHPLGLHHVDPVLQGRLDRGVRLAWRSSDRISGPVLATGAPLIFASADLANEARDGAWLKVFVDGARMHSAVVVAMRASGTRAGVVVVARLAGSTALAAGDVPFVQDVADRLALVVENMLLKEELERLRDPGRVGAPDVRLQDLTPREREILGLIGEGMTNRDIAARLFLSVRTVEWHRARLSAKLGEQKRSALIALGRSLLG